MTAQDGKSSSAGLLINPYWMLCLFALIGSGAYFFALPEKWAAGIAIAAFVVATAANPANGLAFTLLATPFFLGESGWPYYWITEILIYGALTSALAHRLLRGWRFEIPSGRLIALLIIASAASVPIDGKEFYYEFWAVGFSEQAANWLAAHPIPRVNYLRTLMNLVSGLGLFAVACHITSQAGPSYLRKLLSAYVALAGAICLIAVLLAYGAVPHNPDKWRYLGLSLVGKYGDSITGFSYALHFFNQYLLLALPLAAGLAWLGKSRPFTVAFYSAITAAIGFCVIQGGLRTAAIALYLAVLILIALIILPALKGRIKGSTLTTAAGLAVFAVIIGAALATNMASERFQKEIFGRLSWELIKNSWMYIDDPLYFMRANVILEPRLFLWHTAALMFIFSPLLGVGLGRFTALFWDFFSADYTNWEDVGFATHESAHSIYAELLADQGLIGFGLFFSFVLLTLFAGYRYIKSGPAAGQKTLAAALLFSGLMWLFLGITHHTPVCRAIDSSFWISLGMLAGLAAGFQKPFFKGRVFFLSAITCIAVAFVWQVKTVMDQTVNPGFAAGFHNWEKQPDGTVGRWMGRRGVFYSDVIDGKISMTLACPLPGVNNRPQVVTIMADGKTERVSLAGSQAVNVTIPAGKKDGKSLVMMEAAYIVNPRVAGISADDRDLGVIVMEQKAGKRRFSRFFWGAERYSQKN